MGLRVKSKILLFFIFLILVFSSLILAGCSSDIDYDFVCCAECMKAFDSRAGSVGNDALCSNLETQKPLTERCQDYFKKHPSVVEECRKRVISQNQ